MYLHLLNIYTDAINGAIESCETILKELDPSISMDVIHDNAMSYLEQNGTFEDITNSIIRAYYTETKEYVEETFPELKIQFKVDCDLSEIYVKNAEDIENENW